MISRKHSLLFLALLGAFLVTGCGGPGELAPRRYTLVATGFMRGQVDDFERRLGMGHSRARFFGGAARMDALLDLVERNARGRGRRVLKVDLGDFLSGSPEAEVTRGGSSLAIMAGRDYDAVLLGNREFNFGQGVLEDFQGTRSGDRRLPLVTSNLFSTRGGASLLGHSGQPPAYARAQVKLPAEAWGERIRILGLTPTNLAELVEPEQLGGLRIEEDLGEVLSLRLPREGLPGLDVLLCQVDVVARRQDLVETLAGSGIDLVVGHAYGRGARAFEEDGRWYVGVRNDLPGAAMGRWDLDVDPRTGRIVHLEESFFVTLGKRPGRRYMEREEGYQPGVMPDLEQPLPPSKSLLESLAPFQEDLSLLDEPLTEATGDFHGSYREESSLGNLVADALRAADPRAQVALVSAGVVGHNRIRSGPILRRHLNQMFPYQNQLVRIEIPGKALWESLAQMIARDIHVLVSGIRMTWRDGVEPSLGGQVEVGGEPLEPETVYRVLVNSFAHRRDPILGQYSATPVGDCRTLIESYLSARESVHPVVDGRRERLPPR